MTRLTLGLAFAAAAWLQPAGARAAEELKYGPPPAWVVKVEPGTAEEDAEDLPVRTLLFDQQVMFTPEGTSVFNHNVFQILDAQGLAAGNLSIIWAPEYSQPTVHKVQIRRGDEIIDVLAEGQQFSILRREQNLEQAMLDGLLTAHILPEGLQVGDVVEFETTIEGGNPVMGEYVEAFFALNFPSEKSHVRMQWPNAMEVGLARMDDLPEWTITKSGGVTTAQMVLEDVEPILAPRFAPLRHAAFRLAEASNFRSWSELAAHFAPLYEEAAVLPETGSLRDEVERIRQSSGDPVARAEAALRLVQDQIRYVALAMGTGGLKPARAEETWSRRFGDCKGKTALLLAILHDFGIEAEPVFVSLAGGEVLPDRLPAIGLFDHVLVRARIEGKEYWLDGTRTGDRRLANLVIPNLGWGLPLGGDGPGLVRMLPPPLERPAEDMTIHFDASAGLSLPAPARVEMMLRGDSAIELNAALSALAGGARDQALRPYWRRRFSFIDIDSVAMDFDADAAELRLTMTGEADMEWDDGWYQTDYTGVGYSADFDRDEGPNRDAPYAVAYPRFERTRQTIVLPPGFTPDSIRGDSEIDEVVAGIEYKRHAELTGNVFTIEKTERSIAPEFPAGEAAQAERTLRRLADETVFLRKPANYALTAREMDTLLDEKLDDPEDLLRRGNQMLNAGRYADALVDFEDATLIDPGSVAAWAHLGLAQTWLRDFDEAGKSFAKAEAIDPDEPVLLRGQGLLAEFRRDPETAIAAFGRALEIDPDDSFARYHRARNHWSRRNAAAALADADEALESNPGWIELYMLRAEAHHALGEDDKALDQIELAKRRASPSPGALKFLASGIYRLLGRYDEAVEMLKSLAEQGPDPAAFAAIEDPEQRAATELRSQTFLLSQISQLQMEAQDYAGALETIDRAIALDPDEPASRTARGIALWRLGRLDEAQDAFAGSRQRASGAMTLNNICYMKAIAGVALEKALEECQASLKEMPDFPPTLDSRALVYLRLGRLDDAIADYDRAIESTPEMAQSFFGRALAWMGKGDLAKAKADAAEALRLNPAIEREFERGGLRLPPEVRPEGQ